MGAAGNGEGEYPGHCQRPLSFRTELHYSAFLTPKEFCRFDGFGTRNWIYLVYIFMDIIILYGYIGYSIACDIFFLIENRNVRNKLQMASKRTKIGDL